MEKFHVIGASLPKSWFTLLYEKQAAMNNELQCLFVCLCLSPSLPLFLSDCGLYNEKHTTVNYCELIGFLFQIIFWLFPT